MVESITLLFTYLLETRYQPIHWFTVTIVMDTLWSSSNMLAYW